MLNKKLSSPFSTGGGGAQFESHVQALFVLLMLVGGYAPCLPNWPIKKIKLQGKFAGYNTDDLIIYTESPDKKEERKILAQIKHSINITENDRIFKEVIQAAWNDYNNDRLFSKGKDIIALITGPLSAINIYDVRTILEWARYAENANEFFIKINLTNFSSQAKRNKLAAFRKNLTKANGNKPIPDEELFEFLRHFHLLGYDLDVKAGVTLPLLHSLINQYSKINVREIWTQLVDEVQSVNKNAGTITLDTLSEELINAFKKPISSQIPKEITTSIQIKKEIDWNQHQYATDLALANLIGAWDENNEDDIKVLQKIINQDYSSWILKIREILQLPNSPLSLKNGIWKANRSILWDVLGSRIFDSNLDAFKSVAVNVLAEHNPSFDLPPEERYAASIYGKKLKYSEALRNGLAEGLAILGSKPNTLSHCSIGKAKATAVLTVREIFTNSEDWKLWGSLNTLLPMLAEAAPDEFLDTVEKTLNLSSCPFDELFSQEGNGIFGSNYLTGLLWALEDLAWDEKYLVRVCAVLGELATHDPGGSWANRPDNSLVTILLPWLPQTIASIEKRKVAVKTVCKENPEVGWKLLIRLLPNPHQISMGSHKPLWRNPLPDNWKNSVTTKKYWEQVLFYADLAVSIADTNPLKLSELIDHFNNLPKPSFNKLLEILSSETISNYPEDKRFVIWDHLRKFATEYRRSYDTKNALSDESISAIEEITEKLAPSNPFNLYRHLFSDGDLKLYEEKGNWEKQRKKLEEKRKNAIEKILRAGGIEMVIRFAENVKFPGKVGYSLGYIADAKIDSVLLPEYLETNNHNLLDFIRGYIVGHYSKEGWHWVDNVYKKDWSNGQLAQFLNFLPFTNEAWERAADWLGKSEGEYWLIVDANPYETKEALDVAIDKLIKYGRPRAAISCLSGMLHDNQRIDVNQCIRALLDGVSSKEPFYGMNNYDIIDLIKFLQARSDVSPDDLSKVEWAYLPLLDDYQNASPKSLEIRLASNPEFFCEVISSIYRSKKDDKVESEPTGSLKAIAANAWRLLHEWKIPPGIQDNDKFDSAHFIDWLNRVKNICAKSGHLEVALTHVGEVLIHCPQDPDGLWINRTVAETLNEGEAEDMRQGFTTGIYNSRGVHTIDPMGRPERELAEQWKQRAEEIENAGFYRFAVVLRKLSENYNREAESIIAEQKGEIDEQS